MGKLCRRHPSHCKEAPLLANQGIKDIRRSALWQQLQHVPPCFCRAGAVTQSLTSAFLVLGSRLEKPSSKLDTEKSNWFVQVTSNLTQGLRGQRGVMSVGLYSVKPIYRKPKYATRRGVQKERTKGQNVVVLVGGASGENGHVVFIEVSPTG